MMRIHHVCHEKNSLFTFLPALMLMLLVLSGLQGCVVKDIAEHPIVEPEAAYDELYPYYVSACSVTQIKANFAEEGGSAGHAVLFLKGACIDNSRGYPRLGLCDPNTVDLSYPESGTGVSVNKVFENVNWMATPGSELFYNGMLDQGAVTEKALEDTLALAQSHGLWDGIEIHEQYRPASASAEEAMQQIAKDSLSTDFALAFGRHTYCVQLPMSREQIGKIVTHLNGLNDEYADGTADYNWSGYSDNCSHAVHNSLASANVWKTEKVSTTKFRQLFNLSIPANEVIKLGLLMSSFPLENFKKIYYDAAALKGLLDDRWLPAQHGALVEYLPIHYNNELYDTEQSIFLLELPFFGGKRKKFREVFNDSRYTSIRDNLIYFQERYRKILEERPFDWDKVSSVSNPYREARIKYYEYIEAQLEDVKQKLARFSDIQSAKSK